ncbi:uncharacterized protein LOC111154727 [Enhydra lutris kenyoni]|uniref:Uncharacterized protein LOC111154727 n=1 Tax=Enhydra lutris kenyoni TaxID=391180 RepID=A0A2Y9KA36_ENHLU|nr:uncharacterized protein LOC111154727 [Enhydra lutris kenyoni]
MADGDTGDFAPKTVPRTDVRPDPGLLRSARSQVPGSLQGPDQAAEPRGRMPPLRRGEGAPALHIRAQDRGCCPPCRSADGRCRPAGAAEGRRPAPVSHGQRSCPVLRQEEQRDEGDHRGRKNPGRPTAPEPGSAAPRGQGWCCEEGAASPGEREPHNGGSQFQGQPLKEEREVRDSCPRPLHLSLGLLALELQGGCRQGRRRRVCRPRPDPSRGPMGVLGDRLYQGDWRPGSGPGAFTE